MRPTPWTLAAAVVTCLWAMQPCSAGPIDSAVFSLGTPTRSGSKVNFDVTVTFSVDPADAGYQAVYLNLDATNSSGALAPGGDFSAFSFTPSALLNGWTPPAFTFPGEFTFSDESDPTAHGFAASATPYTVGTLTYDLSVFGITSSPSLMMDITGFDTLLADRDPAFGAAGTFDFVTTSFNVGSRAFPSDGGGGGTGGGGGGGSGNGGGTGGGGSGGVGGGGGGGDPPVPEPSSLLLTGLGAACCSSLGSDDGAAFPQHEAE